MINTPQTRMDVALEIVTKPYRYKVCEGCGSICKQKVPVCPLCKSYLWNTDPLGVQKQAAVLGSRAAQTWEEE